MLKPLHEMAEAESGRRLQLAQETYRNAVCSIYAISGDRDYPHLGSGTLFSLENKTYLITARHLLDSGRKALDMMMIANHSTKPISLKRRFIKSNDERDLALCALNPQEIRLLGATPINGLDFFKFPKPMNGRILATIGWPNTKNKLDIYGMNKGQQMVVSGPQKTAKSLGLDNSLDSIFVYQKFAERDAIGLDQQRTNSPKLTGISGGLTFDLGNALDPEILSGQKEFAPHPVGICSQNDPYKKFIQSTRPGVFIQDFLKSGEFLECESI